MRLRVIPRRFPGQLLLLGILWGVTFVPQLHITAEFQLTAFKWFFIAFLGLQHRSYTKLENKVIPPEDRHRSTDKKEADDVQCVQ